MIAEMYCGYKCPICKSSVDIGVSTSTNQAGSDNPRCPSCGSVMIPNPDGDTISMNVYCLECNSVFGVVNSNSCPACGQAFT